MPSVTGLMIKKYFDVPCTDFILFAVDMVSSGVSGLKLNYLEVLCICCVAYIAGGDDVRMSSRYSTHTHTQVDALIIIKRQ